MTPEQIDIGDVIAVLGAVGVILGGFGWVFVKATEKLEGSDD